jgi:archaellum component FlaD/FlaE
MTDNAAYQRTFQHWVHYLLSQFGASQLNALIDEYLMMKWIDQDIADVALKIAQEMDVKIAPVSDYEDHLGISYIFIQKLMGKQVHDDMLPPFVENAELTQQLKSVFDEDLRARFDSQVQDLEETRGEAVKSDAELQDVEIEAKQKQAEIED